MPQIEIPEIVFPDFSGSSDRWEYFRHTFKSLVHDNESIFIAKEMYYLKTSLKSPAAQIINKLEQLNAESYDPR